MAILVVIWWPQKNEQIKRYQIVTVPYLILMVLFYFLFIR
jgi:hypothetical protein